MRILSTTCFQVNSNGLWTCLKVCQTCCYPSFCNTCRLKAILTRALCSWDADFQCHLCQAAGIFFTSCNLTIFLIDYKTRRVVCQLYHRLNVWFSYHFLLFRVFYTIPPRWSIHFVIFCSFLLFSFSFPHLPYLFSSFVHPFPFFYQSSPTLFPGRRS